MTRHDSSPLAGRDASAVRLAVTQYGAAVEGSVEVSSAGAGGRLQVDLLAKSESPAGAPEAVPMCVGRLVRSSLSAGAVPFTVAVHPGARRGQDGPGQLALTVRILLSPPRGAAVTIVRSVVLHSL